MTTTPDRFRPRPDSLRRSLTPTPRLLLLLLLPAPFLAATIFHPLFALSAVLLLLAALGAGVWDARRTLTPADFALEREHHKKFSVWTNYEVTLTVRNLGRQTVQIWVRDEIPADFKPSRRSRRLTAVLPGEDEVKLAYGIRPSRRGAYQFGNIHLRWSSPLRLLRRQATYQAAVDVKVYPSLAEVKEYQMLARRGQIGQIGVRATRLLGQGSEFEQLRDYMPDDDYRRICWSATARRGKPITIDYTVERSQNIIALVDAGQQMMMRALSGARTTRLDLVINAVVLFSYVALQRGDRMGLLIYDREVQAYLPPRPGLAQFYHIVEALYGVRGRPVETDHGRALAYLRAQRQRRSLITLFTEPADQKDADTLVTQLGDFYPNHLPLCITLSNIYVLSAAQRAPITLSTVYERALAEQILDNRRLWQNTLRQRGVIVLDVPAYELTAAVINQYLEIKEHGRI